MSIIRIYIYVFHYYYRYVSRMKFRTAYNVALFILSRILKKILVKISRQVISSCFCSAFLFGAQYMYPELATSTRLTTLKAQLIIYKSYLFYHYLFIVFSNNYRLLSLFFVNDCFKTIFLLQLSFFSIVFILTLSNFLYFHRSRPLNAKTAPVEKFIRIIIYTYVPNTYSFFFFVTTIFQKRFNLFDFRFLENKAIHIF